MSFLGSLGSTFLRSGTGYFLGRGLSTAYDKMAPYMVKAMNPFSNKTATGRLGNFAANNALSQGQAIFANTFNHVGKLANKKGKYFENTGVDQNLGDHFMQAQRRAHDKMMGVGGGGGGQGENATRDLGTGQPSQSEVKQSY